MFTDKKKGRIIIHVEKENGKLNSTIELKGIAKKDDVLLTTLLINFASLSNKRGKDPSELIEKHLPTVIKMLKEPKIDDCSLEEGGG